MVNLVVPDNHPSIPAAVAALPPTGPNDIYVRTGTYDLNPVMKWPPNQIAAKPQLKLHGDGIDKTIVRMAPTQALSMQMRCEMLASLANVSDFTLEDMTLNQMVNPDNQGYNCINFRGGTAHSNIAIRRVKTINSFGSGIEVPRVMGLTVEACEVDNVWTGIDFNGSNISVQRNKVSHCAGDAIFPEGVATDVTINYNVIDTFGDTSIDITANDVLGPPHQRVKAQHNTILNGNDAIRITHADIVEISGNTVKNFNTMSIDSGRGLPSNVWVHDNLFEDFGKLVSRKTYSGSGIGGDGANGLLIENNVMISGRADALWAVNIGTSSTVRNNALTVPGKVGNAAVKCLGIVQGNYENKKLSARAKRVAV